MRAAVAAALLIAAASAPDGSVPQAIAPPVLAELVFNPQDFTVLDDCRVSERRPRVGEAFSDSERAALAPNTRVIRHDVANTLDLRPKRTNVILDESGVIAAIGCY